MFCLISMLFLLYVARLQLTQAKLHVQLKHGRKVDWSTNTLSCGLKNQPNRNSIIGFGPPITKKAPLIADTPPTSSNRRIKRNVEKSEI